MTKRIFIGLLALMFCAPGAWADALIPNWGVVASTPLLLGSCVPLDQSGTTDAHWCNPSAAHIGGLLAVNNLGDVANAATARTNLGAAPTNNPTFTGTVTLPATPQGATGNVAATMAAVKVQEEYAEAAWINRDPNNTCFHIAHQPETITAISGRVTVAAGAGSTASVVKVPSGIVVANGQAMTTTPNQNLLADGSLNTNQPLSLVTTIGTLNLAAGDALCVITNGSVSGNFTTSDGMLSAAFVKQ